MSEDSPEAHRAALAELFDAEVRPHNERFRAAVAPGPDDRVLDIGCGTGESTRDAARTARSVLGVDLSEPALARARELSAHLRNVAYLRADAQAHPFAPGRFDLCVSRFGVMFFADPAAALTNIGRALRPGARAVFLVWQSHERNEWSTAIERALRPPPRVAADRRAFSLGDPAVTEPLLRAAGFGEVTFTDVHEPVNYGPDPATALEFVLGFRSTRDLLAAHTEAGAETARERLLATLAAHDTGGGVRFDSRAWLISARREPEVRS